METIFERVHGTRHGQVIWGLYLDSAGEYVVVTPSRSKTATTLKRAMKFARAWRVFEVTEKTEKYFSSFNLVCSK